MSKNDNKLKAELDKSKTEFELATACLIQAIEAFHKRLEAIESWISENIKNQNTN